jgi:hypothetical protein
MRMLIRNYRFIMPIARGSFEINFSNFKGVFDAEGFEVHVEGRISQSIQTVNVRNAQVEYNSLADFVGSYSIVSGIPPSYVGIENIDIQFEGPGSKKLKLTGTIMGGLDQRYTVTGSGTWSMRKSD